MPKNEKSLKKPTICICPKCGVKHIEYMHWTGRGIPKIFCRRENCIIKIDFDDPYVISLGHPTKHSARS